MNFIVVGIILYILSLWGYVLKKATLEEIPELRKKILFFSKILSLISVFYLLEIEYVLGNTILLIITFIFFAVLTYIILLKKNLSLATYEFSLLLLFVMLFSISYKTIYFQAMILPLLALITNHSLLNWVNKNEITKLIFIIITLVVFQKLI